MATENKTENNIKYVDLYVDKGFGNDDPNEFISINGVNYVLPKGKTSKVPPHVKEEYERSRKAKAALDDKIELLLGKANKPIDM